MSWLNEDVIAASFRLYVMACKQFVVTFWHYSIFSVVFNMSLLSCLQPSWSTGAGTCCRGQNRVTGWFSTPGPSNNVFRRWQHLTGIQWRCFSAASFWEIGWFYFVILLFCNFFFFSASCAVIYWSMKNTLYFSTENLYSPFSSSK